MKQYLTDWSEARLSPAKTIKDLIDCLRYGNIAFIVRANNEDLTYPLKTKNPDLDYHDNWKMSYGVPGNLKSLMKEEFFNDVQKDLTFNYEYSFNHYRCKNGHLFLWDTKVKRFCPLCGLGIADLTQECRPVRLKDPKSRTWITHWIPKKGIPWWITKKLDRKVYTVAYYRKFKCAKLHEKIAYLLLSPLRFIPKKEVFDMGIYKNITYRIGGVTNGYSLKIQIPKRFSFDN